MIVLPLNEVLSRLPSTLARLVLSRPKGTFSFPASVALEQLRTGAVRISFSQLRQSAPPGTFADNTTHDDSLIDLPLSVVLAAIGPGGLARRTDQKRTEVPDEVIGVFAAKQGKANRAAAAVSAPAASPSAPKLVTPAPVVSPPTAPKPVTAAPVVSPPSAPQPVAPVVAQIPAAVVAKPAAPIPAPVLPKPVAPVALPATAPKMTTSIASSPSTTKPASPLPFATARPSPPPPAAAPAPTGTTVVTTIEAVSGAWPDPIRHEIEEFELGSATISIPVNRLETGMKSGRVVFTWAELCEWLSVAPVPPSANGKSSVELPLKVIAPLFLAIPRAVKSRKVVSVSENVPDLFAGLSRPVEPTPEPAPEPAPPEAPVAAPPVPEPAVAPDVLGEILGQPSKTDWTPAEIVQGILAMPGVAGALLASNDGLLVSGQMPAPLEVELMAAFLPQMFTNIGDSTQEVKLGTLRALKITTGQGACAIFKAGELCLAVLGLPGQTLPEPALERIAGELAQPKH
jgi:predicted regulator of Ras-like GTPase activity (Roadblock/LC7/MglB family)